MDIKIRSPCCQTAVKRGLNKRERREKTLTGHKNSVGSENKMAFFSSAITILQTLVVAIGAGLGVWGVINLMEGYGNDNPGGGRKIFCVYGENLL